MSKTRTTVTMLSRSMAKTEIMKLLRKTSMEVMKVTRPSVELAKINPSSLDVVKTATPPLSITKIIQPKQAIQKLRKSPTQLQTRRCLSTATSAIAEEPVTSSEAVLCHRLLEMSGWLDAGAYHLADKILEYSAIPPCPVAVAELLARGKPGAVSEEDSCRLLSREVLVRLANMMMKLAHLPPELLEDGPALHMVQLYCQSFSDIMEVEQVLATTAAGAVGRNRLTGIFKENALLCNLMQFYEKVD